MRLTLRILLAREHGLLNEQQAEIISQKIERSPFVAQLLRHLKDRMTRREIVPLAIEARGHASLENVAAYLDHVLPADQVVPLENECFASDRLLAEVSACHEILAEWLSTPATLEPELRQRLYAIMPGMPELAAPTRDEIAIDFPALVSPPAAEEPSTVRRNEKSLEKTRGGSFIWTAFRLAALAASVAALVTFVLRNRDTVQQVVRQHWHDQLAQTEQPSTENSVPALPTPKTPVPEAFAPKAFAMDRVATPIPSDDASLNELEVETTAYHFPIDGNPSGAKAWHIVSSSGTLKQPANTDSWSSQHCGPLATERLIVSAGGECTLTGNGAKIEVASCSEVSGARDEMLRLRYGCLTIDLVPNSSILFEMAGQRLKLSSGPRPTQLRLTTSAIANCGIDFATAEENQQLHLEGVSGECEVSLSSCRGPFLLKAGQKILACSDQGVRADDLQVNSSFEPPASEAVQFARSLQQSTHPIEFLQRTIEIGDPTAASLACLTLFQLGDAQYLPAIWSRQAERPGGWQFDWRRLVAQDSNLSSQVRQALASFSPEQGPLIYRLVCGFSDEQWSLETRSQLEAMLRHPEPAVRYWAKIELGEHGLESQETDVLP
ncbi:hypothetical protein GC197_11525 [bacterium]|nr:hypothetical protein [bacterium]